MGKLSRQRQIKLSEANHAIYIDMISNVVLSEFDNDIHEKD